VHLSRTQCLTMVKHCSDYAVAFQKVLTVLGVQDLLETALIRLLDSSYRMPMMPHCAAHYWVLAASWASR
jgi:hypothetical protein